MISTVRVSATASDLTARHSRIANRLTQYATDTADKNGR
jgi:hypothetical protein